MAKRTPASRTHGGSLAATCVLLFCCAPLMAAHVRAEESAEVARARDLGHEALDALARGDYGRAEERLDLALALHRAPTLFLARGRARRGLGKLYSASADFETARSFPVSNDETRAFARARADAAEELERLRPQLAHLTLIASTPPAAVRVNGVAWPVNELGSAQPLDPGIYAVEVVSASGSSRTYHVALALGQSQVLTLALEPAVRDNSPIPPPSAAPPLAHVDTPHRDYTLTWVLGTTTVALVAGAVVTGLVALAKRDDYNTRNRPEVSTSEKQKLRDAASTWAWVNTGLWTGAVAAAGSTALAFFVAPTAPSGPEHNVGLQLTAAGRF